MSLHRHPIKVKPCLPVVPVIPVLPNIDPHKYHCQHWNKGYCRGCNVSYCKDCGQTLSTPDYYYAKPLITWGGTSDWPGTTITCNGHF